MPKVLLKVTNIKDAICEAALECDSPQEYARLSASLLSLMDKDETFAKGVIDSAALYCPRREAVAEKNAEAIRSAEIKMKN